MYPVPADFYASNGSQRVKYSRPVSILIEIGVLERTKCVQKCLFFSLVKKCFPPFVKDNEQGPSGRGGGGGGGSRKTDKIFIERRDDVNRFLTVCLLSEIFT